MKHPPNNPSLSSCAARVLALLLFWSNAWGNASGKDADRCFTQAGARYGIAPELLCAIARTESGLDARAAHRNTDGSVDIGIMQVNSRWLGRLRDYGIAPADLWDACLNIHVGAWVLADNIHRYGPTWRAVGAYNAGTRSNSSTEQRREQYAAKVYRNLDDAHVCTRGMRGDS